MIELIVLSVGYLAANLFLSDIGYTIAVVTKNLILILNMGGHTKIGEPIDTTTIQ